MKRSAIDQIEIVRNGLALYVSPAAANFNSAHIGWANSEVSRDGLMVPRICSDGPHLFGIQDCVAMTFAAWRNLLHKLATAFARIGAPALHNVFHVVVVSTPSKMARIAAPGVVAGMEGVSVRKRGLLHFFQSKPVSGMRPPLPRRIARHELPVTMRQASIPRPTLIWSASINFAVKSFVHRLYGLLLCSADCKEA